MSIDVRWKEFFSCSFCSHGAMPTCFDEMRRRRRRQKNIIAALFLNFSAFRINSLNGFPCRRSIQTKDAHCSKAKENYFHDGRTPDSSLRTILSYRFTEIVDSAIASTRRLRNTPYAPNFGSPNNMYVTLIDRGKLRGKQTNLRR